MIGGKGHYLPSADINEPLIKFHKNSILIQNGLITTFKKLNHIVINYPNFPHSTNVIKK